MTIIRSGGPTIKGIVSDLDGVVYRGSQPISGAIEAFSRWQRRGLPFCFVTNNSTHTETDVIRKLAAMGLSISPFQVVTSAIETAQYLKSTWPEDTPVYVIGAFSLKKAIDSVGMRITDRDPAVVVMGLDREISHAKLTLAVQAILSGAILVGTNADMLLPTADNFEPGAGAQLHAVAAATRSTPIIIGKPEARMIETALVRLDLLPSEAMMIGDQLETDIQAGKRAGVWTTLVNTGVPAISNSSLLTPDFLVQTVQDVSPLLSR